LFPYYLLIIVIINPTLFIKFLWWFIEKVWYF